MGLHNFLSFYAAMKTAAFAGVSMLVVGALSLTGGVDYHWGMLVGGLVAALVELAPLPIPLPIDDNLTIPLASGAVMQLLLLVE